MSYFSEQDIDTRTCGQADEDAWLDRRDGLTAHSYTRNQVFSGLAAQRSNATLASRPAANQRDVVNTLAKDMMVALDRGDKAEARRIALELKPFFWMLREA